MRKLLYIYDSQQIEEIVDTSEKGIFFASTSNHEEMMKLRTSHAKSKARRRVSLSRGDGSFLEAKLN